MLDAAFAQIAGKVSAAFGGPYHDAHLLYDGDPIFDDGGSIIDPGTPFHVICSAQVDVATEAMRSSVDFLETDVLLLILGPAALTTAPRLHVRAGPFERNVYELRTARRDPLGFGWECRGRLAGTAAVDPEPAEDGVLDFSDPANSGLLALFLDEMGWPAPIDAPGSLDFSDPAQSGLSTLMMEDA